MRVSPWVAVCTVTLVALPAFAQQQRLSIENFPGDKKGAVRAQVAAAVCAQAECVPPSRVQTRKRLDWNKVRRERLQVVLSGIIVGKGTHRRLSLTMVDSAKKIIWRKALKVSKGGVSGGELGTTVQEALSALALAPPALGGEQAAPQPLSNAPPTTNTSPDDTRPFFSENADAGTAPAPGAEVDAGTPPAPAEVVIQEQDAGTETALVPKYEPRVQPIIVAEIGADVLFRNFAYTNLETTNLFSYRGTGIVMPSLRAELYPLAPFVRGLAAGIGLTGDVALAVGLKSKLEDGTQFPTRVTRWGVGLKWAIRPIQNSGFNFGPEIAYRAWDFEVLPGPGGVTIPQLPPLAYRSLDIVLGFEVPLGGFGMLAAKGSYQPVFSAANLLSPAFFPTGGAAAFGGEGSIGFFVGLGQTLEIRLTGIFQQYMLHFTADPAATYRATGATDRYFGGRLGLRVRW